MITRLIVFVTKPAASKNLLIKREGDMTKLNTVTWKFWTIGVLALLWNAMGALDFTMTQTNNAAYLSGFSPE